jgi:hypothetical protein
LRSRLSDAQFEQGYKGSVNLEQLADVEAGLGIKLPETYRRWALKVPASLAGNATSKVWDDARALIALNLELRQAHGWTARHFALGRDRSGSTGALDLDLGLVLWADQCKLPKPGDDGYQPNSVVEFVEQVLRDLQELSPPSQPSSLKYDAPQTLSSGLIVTAAIAGVVLAALSVLVRSCF